MFLLKSVKIERAEERFPGQILIYMCHLNICRVKDVQVNVNWDISCLSILYY